MTKPIILTTGRNEGHTRGTGQLQRLLKKNGWPGFGARAEQVHRAKVVVVPRLSSEKTFPGADGLLTQAADQPLAIFTADCVPIFLWNRSAGVVGVLHAGWRGVQTEILREAMSLARRQWRLRASEFEAWAGPSIGPCCFEVQWDVARHFPFSRKRRKDRWTVDLVAELKRQAKKLGIRWKTERRLRHCTVHDKNYFSYRRDATDKRQVSLIRKTA